MKPVTKIWKLASRVTDLGLSPAMPLEYVKNVRILNATIGFAVMASLAWFFSSVSEGKHALAGVYVFNFAVDLGLLWLSSRGRHILAMSLAFCLLIAFQVFMTVFVDAPEIKGYYMFLIYVLFPFILFPRSHRRLMWSLALLGAALLPVSLALRGHFGHPVPIEPLSVARTNTMINYTILVMSLTVIAANRYFLDTTETRLVEERDKVSRLSNKLQLFLPRQFVESMVLGNRDTQLDYRRRKLTVFFSDVRGFATWTDKLEPEEVREMLNGYLSEMAEIARKWGGTIDKFIGDSLMVFFGDPEFTNDRDHALRCVKMAFEMQARMAELREGWSRDGYSENLNLRIGINTGWATVGNFGSKERLNYTALGSAVNLAARLESASAPDKITLSHATFTLVQSEIECEPKGAIEVKGFSEPVNIYEVVGPKCQS